MAHGQARVRILQKMGPLGTAPHLFVDFQNQPASSNSATSDQQKPALPVPRCFQNSSWCFGIPKKKVDSVELVTECKWAWASQ